eukprot:COSAG02_NODE_612_length_19541_cov_13.245150_8_plen_77_part_00
MEHALRPIRPGDLAAGRTATERHSVSDILSFAMKDSRCDVWARAHAMWGGWAKRPVATSRVTYRGGLLKVWDVTKR